MDLIPQHGTASLATIAALALGVFGITTGAQSQTGVSSSGDKSFVVEYYYTAKWGHAEEFIQLFKKNHYPVLKKQVELGRIIQLTATKPRYHNTEDGRWDYRVTIVWKNVQAATDDFDEKVITQGLYPDQETFKREEQRRFEILQAHWDLPIQSVDLDKK
jgi:hypothetical protein